MNLKTYLKKRGLTLDVLDYQNYLTDKPNRKRNDDSEPTNSQMVSKVYDKWLSEQPFEVKDRLPKHWSI